MTERGAATGRWRAAEFFAGVGLVRLGLEPLGVRFLWSNDIEPAKAAMYSNHFGDADDHQFVLGDVAKVRASELPSGLDLAWASFPCTDLSVAGWRRGLDGVESSTFYAFTKLLDDLAPDRPPVVALENVVGFATSRGGDDLRAAIAELNRIGYWVDVLALDARRFVPQSRPRLFLVGSQEKLPDEQATWPSELRPDWLQFVFSDGDLKTHQANLPMPPGPATSGFTALAERLRPGDAQWWDDERLAAFSDSLSPIQADRIAKLRSATGVVYRTAYRRTRKGKAVWEVRSDDIAGCLRTARGGSSKQAVVRVGRGKLGVRWMTPLEYARLMGADEFNLEGIRPNQARFGFGDAVCAPAIGWLGENYLIPLLSGQLASEQLSLSLAAS